MALSNVRRVLLFRDSLTAGYTGCYGEKFYPYSNFIKTRDTVSLSNWIELLVLIPSSDNSYITLRSSSGNAMNFFKQMAQKNKDEVPAR